MKSTLNNYERKEGAANDRLLFFGNNKCITYINRRDHGK